MASKIYKSNVYLWKMVGQEGIQGFNFHDFIRYDNFIIVLGFGLK